MYLLYLCVSPVSSGWLNGVGDLVPGNEWKVSGFLKLFQWPYWKSKRFIKALSVSVPLWSCTGCTWLPHFIACCTCAYFCQNVMKAFKRLREQPTSEAAQKANPVQQLLSDASSYKWIINGLPSMWNSATLLIFNESFCLCLCCRCDKDIKVSYTVYNRLSVLLKSLLAITRVTPAYKLSRKQGHDYVILYRWAWTTGSDLIRPVVHNRWMRRVLFLHLSCVGFTSGKSSWVD